LIDTRVDRDFISKEFVKQNRLRQKQKTNSYLLNIINKIPYQNRIIQETKPLEVEIEGRVIIVKFDIVPISKNVIFTLAKHVKYGVLQQLKLLSI